jgi:hypothetical protein
MNCIYCGEKNGLFNFKTYHGECFERNAIGKKIISDAVETALISGQNLHELQPIIDTTSKSYLILENEIKPVLSEAFAKTLDIFYEDHLISKDEEFKLLKFQEHFGLSKDELNVRNAHDLFIKSVYIRKLAADEYIETENENTALSIILQKGEKVLWIFENTTLYEPNLKTNMVGFNAGLIGMLNDDSYYNMSTFIGMPVTKSELDFLASGTTYFTSKNIFFSSVTNSVKIPYDQIISIHPFSDGVSIQKEGMQVKPYIIHGVDGAFLKNIVIAITNR